MEVTMNRPTSVLKRFDFIIIALIFYVISSGNAKKSEITELKAEIAKQTVMIKALQASIDKLRKH